MKFIKGIGIGILLFTLIACFPKNSEQYTLKTRELHKDVVIVRKDLPPPFKKLENKITPNITTKKAPNGTELTLINGEIIESRWVEPEIGGNRVVVRNPNFEPGFIITDKQGSIIDNLQDLHTKMEELKQKNKHNWTAQARKHVPYILVGRLAGENLYFLTNFENPKGSIWQMDLNSREIEKLSEDGKYPHPYIIYADIHHLYVVAQTQDLIVEYQNGIEVDTHSVPGSIISIAADGERLVYRPTNSLDTLHFYNLKDKTTYELKMDEDSKFYNHGGVWSPSGDKFAFVLFDRAGVLVLDLATKEKLIIPPPTNRNFSSINDAITFLTEDIIDVKLSIPGSVQYRIYDIYSENSLK